MRISKRFRSFAKHGLRMSREELVIFMSIDYPLPVSHGFSAEFHEEFEEKARKLLTLCPRFRSLHCQLRYPGGARKYALTCGTAHARSFSIASPYIGLPLLSSYPCARHIDTLNIYLNDANDVGQHQVTEFENLQNVKLNLNHFQVPDFQQLVGAWSSVANASLKMPFHSRLMEVFWDESRAVRMLDALKSWRNLRAVHLCFNIFHSDTQRRMSRVVLALPEGVEDFQMTVLAHNQRITCEQMRVVVQSRFRDRSVKTKIEEDRFKFHIWLEDRK